MFSDVCSTWEAYAWFLLIQSDVRQLYQEMLYSLSSKQSLLGKLHAFVFPFYVIIYENNC